MTSQKETTTNSKSTVIDPQPIINKPHKQSRKQVLMALLVVVLLLCGGVFAVYLNKIRNERTLIPSPLPTQPTIISTPTIIPTQITSQASDWKTYTDNSMEISFKYPQSWYLHSNSEVAGVLINSTNPEMGGNLAGISMKIKEYPTNFNDSTFMKKLEEEYLSFGHGNVEENKKALMTVLIAETKAYRGDSDAMPENLWDHYYFFYHNNKIYDITATEDTGFPERKESEIFDQILSTFRFTDEATQENALSNKCPNFKLRSLPIKPVHTTTDFKQTRIIVRFIDGTGIRLRDGKLISTTSINLNELNVILNQSSPQIERLYSDTEEKLTAEKDSLEAKSCKQMADLNLVYLLKLTPGQDSSNLIDKLNSLSIVEISYPEYEVINP